MNQIIFFIANTVPIWLVLFVTALCVVIGDYFAKLWAVSQNTLYVFLCIVMYSFSALMFLPSLLKEKLAVATVFWSVFMVIGSIFVGSVIFHEHLTVRQWVGILFGVLSIIFITS
jgi:multidrug transporter EmrE-like cation transporter